MPSLDRNTQQNCESAAKSSLATMTTKSRLYKLPRAFTMTLMDAQSAAPERIGGKLLMARETHHVVHNPNGGWDVKRGGGQRSSGHYETKQQAVDAGRKISQNQKTELVIHGMNGRIQSSDSHGNDPCPPKG